MSQREVAETTANQTYGESGTIEGYVFDFDALSNKTQQNTMVSNLGKSVGEEGVLTIKDSTFVNLAEASFQWSGVTKVIIENCTFVGSAKWALAIGTQSTSNSIVYEIRNNLFFNCDRGINIQKLTTTGNVIENNKFVLSNDEKSKAFQIANYSPSHFSGMEDGEVFVTIKDNSIEAAVAVLNLHETLVQSVDLTDCYQHILKFEGTNTCISVQYKVTEDLPDNPFTEDGQKRMNEMVSYFNRIFQ